MASSQQQEIETIVVDLDGTLIKTDTLYEQFLILIKKKPIQAFFSLTLLFRGKVAFKQKIAELVQLDPSNLPFNTDVLTYLQKAKRRGSKLVLATAAVNQVTNVIASHVGLFDETYSSTDNCNLSGKTKAALLNKKFGKNNYTYIGNSYVDLAVWTNCAKAVVVSRNKRLIKRARKTCSHLTVIAHQTGWLSSLLTELRPHQWIKNLLLYIPLLADHKFTLPMFSYTSLGFLSFSFASSSIYILNDLLDLSADRQHPIKHKRAFAAGYISLQHGFLLAPLLLVLSICLAALLPPLFVVFILSYYILNITYSFGLKQIVLIDVFLLAVLYTIRVFAGGAAINVTVSQWLMAFILFLSLSGALLKRFVELDQCKSNINKLFGRGYAISDKHIIGNMGLITGFLSALVLSLYVNSSDVRLLYSIPYLWWIVVILLMYMISRSWLLAYRHQMPSDPVIFLINDVVNYAIIGITLAIILIAI